MMRTGAFDFTKVCKETGVRLTGRRHVIAKVVMEATDHPNAIELHQRVNKIDPRVSLATVYRTLSLLENKGCLKSTTLASKSDLNDRNWAQTCHWDPAA